MTNCAVNNLDFDLYHQRHRAIDIPRDLLCSPKFPDVFLHSPRAAEEALLQKFLPFNSAGGDGDEESDPYSSDHFRMYEFKVRRCTRIRCHDWTDCPFVHPGEKARRRDPRKYHYSGDVCAEFRRGSCSRGDNCDLAHGVFENWLHPTKYRTEACKDGKSCKRKICFFAHTPRQLRLLPPSPPPPPPLERKYKNPNNCCLFCHSPSGSPTSTLMGISNFDKFSQPMSPLSSPSPSPLSPVRSTSMAGIPPIGGGVKPFNFNLSPLSYRGVANELRSSLEAMKLSEDCSDFKNLLGCYNGGEEDNIQQQFSLSPMVAAEASPPPSFRGFSRRRSVESGLACADIDWVDDLLT